MNDQTDIQHLREENRQLKERLKKMETVVADLKARLDVEHSENPGLVAEKYIAALLHGRLEHPHSPHDITLESGLKIEVKYAKCSHEETIYNDVYSWTWAHCLGYDYGKEYDRLILVGEPCKECLFRYIDKGAEFVLFDVPHADVFQMIRTKTNQTIKTNSDPSRVRGRVQKALFEKYQVTARELQNRYRNTSEHVSSSNP